MSRITAASWFVGVLVMSMAARQASRVQKSLRVGDPFPALEGRSLAGRDAALRRAASGKVILVAMGFTYQSRFPVEAWADWYRKTVGSRADVPLFEVPIIGGFDQSRVDNLHALLTALADPGRTAAAHHLAPRSAEP